MISLCCVGLLLGCFSAFVDSQSQRDVTVECQTDSVVVRVGLTSRSALPVDPSGLLLGNCPPFSSDGNTAVFQSSLLDCRFMRMATASILVYSNELSYKPSPGFNSIPFNELIVCSYNMTPGWTPPVFNPALGDASGFGTLVFFMEVMNDDFSAPRVSTTFFLGSLIPIRAAVDQQFHMPLILFLEECVAATTAVLSPSSQTYSLINNYGCLVDGQVANSKFLPRVQSSEIQLVVQAFKFTEGEDVYIHCQLAAWDPQQLDPTKKACNFNKTTNSWELLDDPNQNSLCSCCSSICTQRKKRELGAGNQGLMHTTVLGPLKILAAAQASEHGASVKKELSDRLEGSSTQDEQSP